MDRTLRVLIILFAGGFGVALLCVGVTEFFQQRRLLTSAHPVQAEIIDSSVRCIDSSAARPGAYCAAVRFRYRIDGAEYESDRLYPTFIRPGYESPASAAAELAPFPPRANVVAHVDPEDPARAFLVPRGTSMPLMCILLGLVIPPVSWIAGRRI